MDGQTDRQADTDRKANGQIDSLLECRTLSYHNGTVKGRYLIPSVRDSQIPRALPLESAFNPYGILPDVLAFTHRLQWR